MGKVEKVSLEEFVSEQVNYFLKNRRENHLGILIYNVKNPKLSSLLARRFRKEFKKKGLKNIGVVAPNGFKEYPPFSLGDDFSADGKGYYGIDVNNFLDSSSPEYRFNISHFKFKS